MAVLGSSVVVGQALASMIVGSLAESAGPSVALWAPVVAVVLLLVFGLLNLRVGRIRP